MKANRAKNESGSVLVMAMTTMTIIAFVCATSLYISMQNTGNGLQAAGWQQALTAAESGVDAAVRALNATASGSPSPWGSWKTTPYASPVSGYTLPTAEPSSSTAASGTPNPVNYLPSSALTLNFPNTEGSSSVSAWVTVDKVGTNLADPNGKQWYRIRSTGKTAYPTNSMILRRASNNRLDSELRNTIAMNFSRKGGNYTGPTRTIEAIVSPQGGGTSIWGPGTVLKNALTMSGSGILGHVNSNNVPMSTFVGSPAIYRSTDYTETVVAMLNANGSNLSNTYVYGAMAYSTTGAVPQNTKNVQGPISSPYNGSAPTVSNPTWTPDATFAAGSPPFTTISPGSNNNSPSKPYKVKVTGNFTVPGGKALAITAPNGGKMTYLEVWITGSFTTSGTGVINQDPLVHVTYYVDGSVTTSGGSFNNQTGQAQNNQMIVVGGGDVTVSGSGNYIGTIEAPDSKVTVSGSGMFIGGLIGNTLNISGGASFYVDDALASYTGDGGSSSSVSYAFSNWFEDNSDPLRNALDTDFHLHPIIY